MCYGFPFKGFVQDWKSNLTANYLKNTPESRQIIEICCYELLSTTKQAHLFESTCVFMFVSA